jgi:hypothetical protein
MERDQEQHLAPRNPADVIVGLACETDTRFLPSYADFNGAHFIRHELSHASTGAVIVKELLTRARMSSPEVNEFVEEKFQEYEIIRHEAVQNPEVRIELEREISGLEISIPTNAAIRKLFATFREVDEELHGEFYSDTIRQAERFALFLIGESVVGTPEPQEPYTEDEPAFHLDQTG